MNAGEIFPPGLRTVALAAVSAALPDNAAACTHYAWTPSMLAATVAALRAMPPPDDAALVALADHFALSDAELLAATLAAAVEEDARLCREIAAAQAPLGATALGLATGPAVASGMLRLGSEDAPLPERTIAFHLPTLAALHGRAAEWDDVRPAALPDMALPQQRIGEAERWARALAGGTRGLVVRCASPAEAMASSALVVERLGRGLAHTARAIPGLAAWLVAAKRCRCSPRSWRRASVGRFPIFRPMRVPGSSRPVSTAWSKRMRRSASGCCRCPARANANACGARRGWPTPTRRAPPPAGDKVPAASPRSRRARA